eukprot:gene8499-9369_t
MSSRSGKWSSDYSFLINTIEGSLEHGESSSSSSSIKKVDSNTIITNKSNKLSNDDLVIPPMSAKRRRITPSPSTALITSNRDSTVEVEEEEEDDLILLSTNNTITTTRNNNTNTNNSSTVTSSKKYDSSSMKLKVEIDELKLTNEQLRDQLKTYKYEHEFFKEQTVRQLTYIEEQNQRLKHESEGRLAKYYEEKKKWQGKVRELESQLAVSKASATSATSTASARQVRREEEEEDEDDNEKEGLKVKILDLEKRLSEEGRRCHEVNKVKLELENRTFQLEKEVSLWRTAASSQDPGEVIQELHSLRKHYQEMESQYQRQKKEMDKLEKLLKNQKILEEEIATLKFRNNLLEESHLQWKTKEQGRLALEEEMENWKTVLGRILSDYHQHFNDLGERKNDIQQQQQQQSLSPLTALTVLQDYQENYTMLMTKVKELEGEISFYKQSLEEKDKEIQTITEKSTMLTQSVTQLEARNALFLQRTRLFEGEINSLRHMLQTYDMEFAIGKPQVDKMVSMKEEMISSLRLEVDKLRKQGQEWADRVAILEDDLKTARATPAVVNVQPEGGKQEDKEELERLKQTVDDAESNYKALQEITGVDFLPHRTQVLRFSQNPFDVTRGRKEMNSTLPWEVVQRLKKENKALSARVEQSSFITTTSSQEDVVGNPASANSNNMSVMNDMNVSYMQNTTFTGGSSSGQQDHAKLNQRLKEMFKEKISTFREAVYLLTGFKVDMLSSGGSDDGSLPRLRLRSMYAEQPEDCLMFQLRGDTPELLETEFMSRVGPQHLHHLQTFNSVPAFLANLTLELFESQTYMA